MFLVVVGRGWVRRGLRERGCEYRSWTIFYYLKHKTKYIFYFDFANVLCLIGKMPSPLQNLRGRDGGWVDIRRTIGPEILFSDVRARFRRTIPPSTFRGLLTLIDSQSGVKISVRRKRLARICAFYPYHLIILKASSPYHTESWYVILYYLL